jgi:hypothetical protein
MKIQIDLEDAVKFRDHTQAIADTWNDVIERANPDRTKSETRPQYDIMKVVTRQTEGRNGFYLKASAEDNKDNPDFLALVEDLKAHKGKLSRQGYFVWRFDKTETETVGMKQSKK